MSDFSFDLFVIGAGSGGVRASRMAAQRGARVAVADCAPLGGTCVNLGCIPKKLYSFASHYAEAFEESRGFGWTVAPPVFDWETLKANRAAEISRLNAVYLKLLTDAGVEVIRGRARVCGANEVEVDGKRHTARHLLVATGGHPTVPAIPGRDLVVTSNEIFDLPAFPKRLVVVGGGYIACEFASIFQGLGARVTQLYRGDQVLRGFDDEVRDFVAAEMRKKGVDVRTHADVERIERSADGLALTLVDGSVLVADTVLYATGRHPNTGGLGLAEQGVVLTPNGAVAVDAHYRTNLPSVHALGDVIDRVQLTPVALAEAMAIVDRLFGSGERSVDYDLIPTAVFTHPNVGTVGLSERAARERFGAVRVFRSEFRALRHTLSGNTERTLMKLVVDAASDRVVGLHIVGADAGEIVQGFAVAMRAGATKAVFDTTIGIHPTMAEEFVTMRQAVGMIDPVYRKAPSMLRTLPLLAFCLVGSAFAADPPRPDAPAKPAAAKPPAADKILTPAQLRDCLAQQQKVRQQDADAEKQKEALAAEKAEIARVGEALAAELASLDRTNAEAVNAYNDRAQARDTRIDAYESSIDRYNARAATLNADHDAFAKSCNNRRFLEDDETAIKKGK